MSDNIEQDWATPIFRTVATPGGRHALKLEAAFWEALEVIARQSNRKVMDVVREIMGEQRREDINATRAVRSAVVKRLLDEHNRLAPLAAPLAVIKLMQQAPVPSFALDRQKRLVRVNDEFVHYLRTIVARTTPLEAAHLSLDRPTEQLFAEIQLGAALECGVSIRVDSHERRTQARLVMPPLEPATVLVGFIII